MSLPCNLGDFVSRTGAPDRPLIIGLDGDGATRVMTRAAFDALADAFARGLLKRGIRRGERIAILAANRPDYVAVFMGAMRAGIVPVPVNFKFPAATIAQVIADSGARLVVHDEERLAALSGPALPGVERVAFDGDKRAVIDGPFTETKEIVAGYWLWEVKDMDEAVAWVKRCPNPMPGPSEIELRELYDMEDFDYAMTPEADEIHARNKAAMEGR